MNVAETLVVGGEVYDGFGHPAQSVDVRIVDGVVAEIGPNLSREGAQVVDARGQLVAPGLIDLHVHVFSGIGLYSVDPIDAGLKTGVTSMLDTGTAGSLTYAAFERFVIDPAEEDIFALLNISMIGCIQGHPDYPPYMGDLHERRYADVANAVACVRKHPKRIVGLKVRLTSGLADYKPENERAGFDAVFEAAEQLGLPLMVHHVASKIPLAEVLDRFRPGDILTHVYHPHADHGFDELGAPTPEMLAARRRGVVFDVGHGVGAFSWRVAEGACLKHGFWPDTISTDVHQFNLQGPVFDMPTTMSKFLHLGMPLADVVRASTHAPAKAMRVDGRLGALAIGQQADVVLMRLDEGEFPLVDVKGEIRLASRRLVPTRVCKRGVWRACGV